MNGMVVELGGQSRTIKFTHNALARLEGQGLGWKAIGPAWDQQPIRTLRAMIWATCPEGTTLEQVGDWMDAADLVALGKAIWAAYLEALPKSGAADPPLAAATTGVTPAASPTVPSP